jgi:hypothetical protein
VLDGRTGQAAAAADGTRLWAGRIADSFYIDLSLLARINAAVASGTAPDLSGWRPEAAQNSFNGRTQADNAPEAMLSLVTGMAVPSGLKPAIAKDQRASTFPYVVPA